MKYIIPAIRNNTYPFADVEFGIEDDATLGCDDPHTVTLFVRPQDESQVEPAVYATVKAADLVKALEWLKRWA